MHLGLQCSEILQEDGEEGNSSVDFLISPSREVNLALSKQF